MAVTYPTIHPNCGMQEWTKVLEGTGLAQGQTLLSNLIPNSHRKRSLILKMVIANASGAVDVTPVIALPDDDNWSDSGVAAETGNGTNHYGVGQNFSSGGNGADDLLANTPVPSAFKLGIDTGTTAETCDVEVYCMFGER